MRFVPNIQFRVNGSVNKEPLLDELFALFLGKMILRHPIEGYGFIPCFSWNDLENKVNISVSY